ncbi:hypothetical protein TNCV_1311101 [Trichonephila clavipes]|nr:hypothetical protein TNCV_1311101 [Trichonephila clavipes]
MVSCFKTEAGFLCDTNPLPAMMIGYDTTENKRLKGRCESNAAYRTTIESSQSFHSTDEFLCTNIAGSTFATVVTDGAEDGLLPGMTS